MSLSASWLLSLLALTGCTQVLAGDLIQTKVPLRGFRNTLDSSRIWIANLAGGDYNPAAEITCSGSVPQHWQTLTYQEYKTSSPRYNNPVELCAKHKYGGSNVWNVGFYCGNFNGQYGPVSGLVRDIWDIVGAEYPNDHKEIAVFCSLRCRCSSEPAARAVSEYDSLAWTDMPLPIVQPSRRGVKTTALIQWLGRESKAGRTPAITSAFSVTMNPTELMAPVCSGPLPHWPLPVVFGPFLPIGRLNNPANGPFVDVNELCQSIWSGGYRYGNAGAVCRKQGSSYQLEFQEYSAHPRLGRAAGDEGLKVELWCQRACNCNAQPPQNGILPSQVSFTDSSGRDSTASFTENDVIFKAGTFTGGSGDAQDSTSGGSVASDIEGHGIKMAETLSKQKWGQPCSKQADCRNGPADRTLCVFEPTIRQLARLGKGPFLPVGQALCLPFIVAMIESSSRARLGG